VILKTREPVRKRDKLHRLVRPQKSHGRTLRYWFKRVLRIRATPHALALGVSIGVFASFSPLLGVHFLFAIVAAFLLRANMVAAGVATAAANPLTFPLMVAGNYETGHLILGSAPTHAMSMHEMLGRIASFDFHGLWEPVFKPLFIGSMVLGGLFAVAAYFMVYFAARTIEQGRAERRSQRETLLP
jgi:uncharacterized protein